MRKAGWKGSRFGSWRARMNVSKNHVVCARCHLTGLASGIDWIAQSSAVSGAARPRVTSRTARNRSACALAPGAWGWRTGSFIAAPSRLDAASSDPDVSVPVDDLADDGRVVESLRSENLQDFFY